jgi:hypothetical protein
MRIWRKKIERRVLPRIKFYNFIRYKTSQDPSDKFVIANVKNISGSGILFLSKRDFPLDTVLDIDINFPGLDAISVKAKIVRSRRTQTGEYEIGAHFVIIDDSVKASLAKRIEFVLDMLSSKKLFWRRLTKKL